MLEQVYGACNSSVMGGIESHMTMRRFGWLLILGAATAVAQKTVPAPVTDSAAQASPVVAVPKVPATDDSIQASPALGPSTGSKKVAIAAHTAIPIVLVDAVDSGKVKNGQSIQARLVERVGMMPAGTPVVLSVVAAVPAGKLMAVGEMSLEVDRVGNTSVTTEVQTFRGKPGPKDVADAVPQGGTEAVLAKGAALTFHVQPSPTAASGAPKSGAVVPGSVMPR